MNTMETEILTEILESKAPFATEEEEATSKKLISELNEEDKEVAARTSFAYYIAATTSPVKPSEEVRHRMATREARRHLAGENGDYEKAKERFRECLEFRKEYKLDVLRTCFDVDMKRENEEEEKLAETYRDLIKEELKRQPSVVRGHSKENCALVLKYGRQTSDADEKGFSMTKLFVLEKAMACTEYLSKGQEEKFIGVFHYADNVATPSKSAFVSSIKKIRLVVAERLRMCVIMDPPFMVRTAFGVISPFLAKVTLDKIKMTSTVNDKVAAMGELIDPKFATTDMLPDGKAFSIDSDFDMEKFLYKTPYHKLYDEDN